MNIALFFVVVVLTADFGASLPEIMTDWLRVEVLNPLKTDLALLSFIWTS